MKHIPILLLSAALLAASPLSPLLPNACAQSQDKERVPEPHERTVDVFVSKEYRSLYFPALINVNGILVAAAGAITRGDGTAPSRHVILISTSDDDGQTWSKPMEVASAEGAIFDGPCLVYDEVAHRIVLFFQRYPAGMDERSKDFAPGHENERCIRNFVCFSVRGKKWSIPKDVTEFTKNEGVVLTSSGPNPGVQIKHGKYKGRLVVPLCEGTHGDRRVAAAYSDDHGKTWNIGKQSAAGNGIYRVSIAETDDGGLVVVTQAWRGKQREIVYSQDGGESWEEISSHPQLPISDCQNSMVRYSFEDDDQLGNQSRLLFSAPATDRIEGTIKMSFDNGKTRHEERHLIPESYTNSSLTPVSPGIMGVLYDLDGGRSGIRFTTFSIDWLTNGEDSGVGKGVKVKKYKKPKERRQKSKSGRPKTQG